MIGEIWESSETWLQGDMFDSTMNYDFRKNCRDFFGTEAINATEFNARVTKMNYRYPTGILQGQLNLLDSHDVNRFFSYCQKDIRRLRLAEVFLFTAPGTPCVFYGDELGMDGDHEETLRGPMPWDAPFHDEREFFRTLVTLRRENKALIYGSYRALFMDEDGLYIYRRQLKEHTVTIALTARNHTAKLEDIEPLTDPMMSDGFEAGRLAPFGYAVWTQ